MKKGMFRVKIEYDNVPLTDSRVNDFGELDDLILKVKKKVR